MMQLNGGYDQNELYQKLAHLGQRWLSHCTNPAYGHPSLIATGLTRYLEELSQLQQPDTNFLLFPCNFEIYAFCVEQVMRDLVAFESDDTITVWTILSVGLLRWYNLSLEDSEGNYKEFLAYTREDWENYKSQISELAKHQHRSANVQMRRIIAPYNEDRVSNLYV